MNTFPNEGNSSPQSHHSLCTTFAHFCSYLLFPPSLFLSHLSLPPLPRALVSIFFASSHLCSSFFTLSVSHFSHLPTAIHQLFAISFPFPLFIISSIKSIYNTGSLNNCCAIKIFYRGSFNSNPVVVSSVSPVLLYWCKVSSANQLNSILKAWCYNVIHTEVICETPEYSFKNPSPLLHEAEDRGMKTWLRYFS